MANDEASTEGLCSDKVCMCLAVDETIAQFAVCNIESSHEALYDFGECDAIHARGC
jgi:hypothetical protein